MHRSLLAFGCVLLTACALDGASEAGARAEAVVFGADDRAEVYTRPDDVIGRIARSSIAMQVERTYLDTSSATEVRITTTETYAELQTLCEGEAFREQISAGTCSGTLIDERHLLTAGHCVVTMDDCTGWDWVFGWHYESAGVLRTLTPDDHYRCTGITVRYEVDDVDYAVIELDRPAVGHEPVAVRTSFAGLPEGTALTMIGHPEGIPMKITGGARVLTWDEGGHFASADLDAFSGNSGSGVFTDDGVLVGILVTGEDDYEQNGACQVVRTVPTVAPRGGEGVTTGVSALEDFCRSGVTSTACPAGGVEAPPGERPVAGGRRRDCSVAPRGRTDGPPMIVLGSAALAFAAMRRRRRPAT